MKRKSIVCPSPSAATRSLLLGASALLIVFASATAAWAQQIAAPMAQEKAVAGPTLRAVPDELTFDTLETVHKVTVTRDGKPVAAKEFGKPRLMAGKSDYAYMLTYTPSTDELGVLIVKPDPNMCEVGSYDLQIPVNKDYVSVAVYTPLSQIKSIIDKDAAKLGTEAAKLEHGLTKHAGRETLEVTLAPEYQVGQEIVLELPLEASRTYRWVVNGKVLQDGPKENTLRYTFPEPGDYEIGVTETEGAARVAQWKGTAHVTGTSVEPAIAWKVPANTPFTVPAPKGYQQYSWSIDGKEAAGADSLTHQFPEKGTHVIECRCSKPTDANRPADRRVTWKTIVE